MKCESCRAKNKQIDLAEQPANDDQIKERSTIHQHQCLVARFQCSQLHIPVSVLLHNESSSVSC